MLHIDTAWKAGQNAAGGWNGADGTGVPAARRTGEKKAACSRQAALMCRDGQISPKSGG
jgi:hypothetical protein